MALQNTGESKTAGHSVEELQHQDSSEGKQDDSTSSSHSSTYLDPSKDDNKGHQESETPSANSASEGDQTRAFRNRLESFAVYVGIPAVTLYPLGFAALWLQILITDGNFPSVDLDTAWYAASLVPKVVVVRTGLFVLFLSLIFSALGFSTAMLIFNVLHWWREYGVLKPLLKRSPQIAGIGLLVIAIVSYFQYNYINTTFERIFLISIALPALLPGFLIGYLRVEKKGKWPFRWLAIAYVGAMVGALGHAVQYYPALPMVEIKAPESTSSYEVSEVPEARGFFTLLSYDENYWFVYSQDARLEAIPTGDAQIVRFWDRDEKATLEEDRLPDTLRNSVSVIERD